MNSVGALPSVQNCWHAGPQLLSVQLPRFQTLDGDRGSMQNLLSEHCWEGAQQTLSAALGLQGMSDGEMAPLGKKQVAAALAQGRTKARRKKRRRGGGVIAATGTRLLGVVISPSGVDEIQSKLRSQADTCTNKKAK